MNAVLSRLRQHLAYDQLLGALRGREFVGALGLPQAARLPILAALYQDLGTSILFLTDRPDHAIVLGDELEVWLGRRALHCAEPTPLFYERAAWDAVTRIERLQCLIGLLGNRLARSTFQTPPQIVVASSRALMTRTMPPEDFLRSSRSLRPGMTVRFDALRRELHSIGYDRSPTVVEAGQYANRGGLLDVWTPAESMPLRLEFAGNEIETVRVFDPVTQRTIRSINDVLLTPAREYTRPEIDVDRSLADETEFQIPLIYKQAAGLLDYVDSRALVVVEDAQDLETMLDEVERQAVQLRLSAIGDGSLGQDHPLPYLTPSEIHDHLQSLRTLVLGRPRLAPEENSRSHVALSSAFKHEQRFGGRLASWAEYVRSLGHKNESVIVVSRQRGRLQELLKEDSEPLGGTRDLSRVPAPEFHDGALREGFVMDGMHIQTDAEIFGWPRPPSRVRSRVSGGAPEFVYGDLRPGDYVVHIDHGIGVYLGLVQRQLDGQPREYLAVEYGAGGQLFVPVHQADRLTRYVGSAAMEPTLDRLGGQEWHHKKGRARDAVLAVAEEMIELHARREIARGHNFAPDTTWQAELEDSFPYFETDDQKRAMDEIKRDMETPKPMDRLLCGDVGYGKTELALRAGFKAVMDGKQVAILVPTTVLAQQHFETFIERLAPFPVRVDMLSRFRSPKEQDDIVARLEIGTIDILVGTHRMLSSDVRFKDLGLVIIDEEQRFGVSHKEHLKQLRAEVDVLTMTATPIPRTLYMALTGVRDISMLNTPPEARLPIITHVGPYSPRLARQAILRELDRGGQVFFVHNRVHTIHAMRAHLSQLVPEARIDVGHGQMPEHELEEVMHRFNGGQTDILLSTTIIESGLDIPNANTLIVDRADTFGLAQLYQLRGRVGRGAARAYAYFFRHGKVVPALEAQQRLDVIAENTELGAGYSIAMRDLEIRGAGDLLGTQQHGHIQAIGFHLYTRLLADAVRRMQREQIASDSAKRATIADKGTEWHERTPGVGLPVSVELPLAIGIPPTYVTESELRLRLYRRIADIRDEGELSALATEFHDRFGPVPEMVSNLLFQMRVKLRAERAGLSAVLWEAGQIVLRYPSAGNGRNRPRLPDLGPGIRGGKGAYWCLFGSGREWMPRLLSALHQLRSETHFSRGDKVGADLSGDVGSSLSSPA